MKDTQQKPAVICLSGGMDSTSLLLRMLADGHCVFGVSFDYGQKHKLELQRLAANLDYLSDHGHHVENHVIDMSVLGNMFHSALTNENWQVPEGFYEQENMKATVVPNRNAIFASIAFGYALSIATRTGNETKLCLGVHSGDHAIYPDCRPEFYESLFHAFSVGNWDSNRVSLHLPYLDGDKFTILQDARQAIEKLDLEFNTIFRNTITSYDPDSEGRSNGKTGSDVERILAFHKLGIQDPVKYICSWEEAVANALAMQAEHESAK